MNYRKISMHPYTIEPPTTIKIKPCKYCDSQPEIVKESLHVFKDGAKIAYFVECKNPKCKVKPKTKPFFVTDYTDPITSVCIDWNVKNYKNLR